LLLEERVALRLLPLRFRRQELQQQERRRVLSTRHVAAVQVRDSAASFP
jgi:hypothetical protein